MPAKLPGRARIMAEMTVKEMRDDLKKCQTVILPIGCVEQHGYHLPLSVDIHNAEQLATRAAAETGSFVAPTLPYNYSGGELPGTVNVNPHVVALMVSEICAAFARQGFKNIIVVPGHGGTESVACIESALDMFLRQNPQHRDVAVSLAKFWEVCPTLQEAFAQGDYHAGKFETSLMMFWQPKLVRDKIAKDTAKLVKLMRDDPDNYQSRTKPVDNPHVMDHIAQRADIKVGVMGQPEEASAAFGKKVCDEAVAFLVKLIRDIEKKRK